VKISVVTGVPVIHDEDGYETEVVAAELGFDVSRAVFEVGCDDGDFGEGDAGFDIEGENGWSGGGITLETTVTVKGTGIKLDAVENSTIVVVVGISLISVVETVIVVT
jgi:hypothetical protein